MGSFSSEFEEILKRKLNNGDNFELHSKQTLNQSCFNNAQILFMQNLENVKKTRSPWPQDYRKSQTQIQRPQELKIRVAEFSESQKKALSYFIRLGAHLGAEICKAELTREWRKILFKFHPDTGTQDQSKLDCAELAKAYQTLKEAFNELQQAA